MASLQGQELNAAKIILADEVTRLIRGPDSLQAIHAQAHQLFDNSGSLDAVDAIVLTREDLPILIDELCVRYHLTASKSEARRLVAGRGLKVNDTAIDDQGYVIHPNIFTNGVLKISLGKKKHYVFRHDAALD